VVVKGKNKGAGAEVNLYSIFLLSIVILYLEVLLIRWISTEVNIFAYLQNTILVVCLLALGAGCLRPKQKVSFFDVLAPLAIIAACQAVPITRDFFASISSSLSIFHDFVVWNQAESGTGVALRSSLGLLGIVGAGTLALLLFKAMVPLGIMLGAAFAEARKPIVAYSVNVAGSLIGILLFALMGYLSCPPWMWIFLFVLLSSPYILGNRTDRIKNICVAILLVACAWISEQRADWKEILWSPYQKLALSEERAGGEYEVRVNNARYQKIQNNSLQYRTAHPDLFLSGEIGLGQYDLPSRMYPDPREVLIVGAGTGNDVAGVLRGTSAKITAVEIDPVVYDLGRRLHPEHPYSDPRVEVVLTDARAYFQHSDKKFDLIIFGLLDSHTTPTLTNARLDHYVYTQEALTAVSRLLTPKGVVALMFQPQRDFIIHRLSKSILQVFGTPPLVTSMASSSDGWGGYLFITGNLALARQQINSDPKLQRYFEKNEWRTLRNQDIEVTTDDWPYLYIEKPSIPTLFFLLLPIFAGLWIYASRQFSFRTLLGARRRESLHFLALGAAFTLLEVYGVNQAAVIFGNTWVVNCVIIGGILIMILGSNAVISAFPNFPRISAYFGLLSVIVILSLVPFSRLIGMTAIFQVIFTAALCGLPMLFSGIIFAQSFKAAEERNQALSANLFGALVGGILQLMTFITGIRSLLILVFGFYVIASLSDALLVGRKLNKNCSARRAS
jgi:spermidine synthase